jgi:c-di-GMP-related signal transduction protein
LAYELLYRSSHENHAGDAHGEKGTVDVLVNAIGTFGRDEITGEKRAFVNLTRHLPVANYAPTFPRTVWCWRFWRW